MTIEPITVNYVPGGDDWTITLTAGADSVTDQAPGLIAARDRADQLVDTLVPEQAGRVVVHLLDGDALAFTTAYLQARHGSSAPTPAVEKAEAVDTPNDRPAGGEVEVETATPPVTVTS